MKVVVKVLKTLLASTLLLAAGWAQAAILVTFTGSVDYSNPGPLASNSPITGSFFIDDSIASTGGNMVRHFDHSISDLVIDVVDPMGPFHFTGGSGKVTQLCQNPPAGLDHITPCDPGTRFISIDIDATGGSVNGFDFDRMAIDFRGDALFDNPFNLGNDLHRDALLINDFSYARMVMHFDGAPFSMERSLDTIHFSAINSVPLPGTIYLFGTALCALGVRARRRLNEK